MKKFFKSTAFKIITWLIVFAIALTVFLACIIPEGTNYTQQYNTYKQVKEIELLSELKEYCIENNILYSISNSEIAIFPNTKQELTFKIVDNQLIAENLTRNTYFELLENGTSSEIYVSAYEEDGEILEELWINHNNFRYVLKDGQFYQKFVLLSGFIMVFSALTGASCLYHVVDIILVEIQKLIDAKKKKTQISKRQSDVSDRNEC